MTKLTFNGKHIPNLTGKFVLKNFEIDLFGTSRFCFAVNWWLLSGANSADFTYTQNPPLSLSLSMWATFNTCLTLIHKIHNLLRKVHPLNNSNLFHTLKKLLCPWPCGTLVYNCDISLPSWNIAEREKREWVYAIQISLSLSFSLLLSLFLLT